MSTIKIGALALAGLLALGSTGAEARDHYRHRHGGGGNVAGAIIGGLALGAIGGAVLAPRYGYAAPPPVVYAPPPVAYDPFYGAPRSYYAPPPVTYYTPPPVAYAPPGTYYVPPSSQSYGYVTPGYGYERYDRRW